MVLDLLKLNRGIAFGQPYPSPWISGLMRSIRNGQRFQVVDHLICCSLIEGRSCEKFQILAAALQSTDPELGAFYHGLVESEGNHYATYILMAKEINETEADQRLNFYLDLDADLVRRAQTRYHRSCTKQPKEAGRRARKFPRTRILRSGQTMFQEALRCLKKPSPALPEEQGGDGFIEGRIAHHRPPRGLEAAVRVAASTTRRMLNRVMYIKTKATMRQKAARHSIHWGAPISAASAICRKIVRQLLRQIDYKTHLHYRPINTMVA